MAELLIDTTYLLPFFGVSVELVQFESRFEDVLGTYEVSYNPVSLVEAKWIVLKIIRRDPSSKNALLTSYRTGLKVLESDGRLRETALTSDAVETAADDLHEAGMKDYFDRMIYATASERGCALLTEDRDLLKPGRGVKQKPGEALNWGQLVTRVKRAKEEEE